MADKSVDRIVGGFDVGTYTDAPLRADCLALLDAPPAKIFAHISDHASLFHWLPLISASTVSRRHALARDGVSTVRWLRLGPFTAAGIHRCLASAAFAGQQHRGERVHRRPPGAAIPDAGAPTAAPGCAGAPGFARRRWRRPSAPLTGLGMQLLFRKAACLTLTTESTVAASSCGHGEKGPVSNERQDSLGHPQHGQRSALGRVIPAMQQSRNGVVVAIGSRDQERAQQAADTLGIPRAHGSYESPAGRPRKSTLFTIRCPTACTRSGAFAVPKLAFQCSARSRWPPTPPRLT